MNTASHPVYLLRKMVVWFSLILPMPVFAETIVVAIAANFTDASKDLIQQFEKSTGHTVKASYGSTGKLYAHINNGAPYDVLLAADQESVIKLDAIGLTVADTRFTYARGRLSLWSAKPNLFKDGEQYIKAGHYKHFAIANPLTAPYGKGAQQVLQHLGVWPTVQAKLVQGDSIAQAFQFVATQNAEAGLVATSQVMAWQKGGSRWDVPENYYRPIIQQAVLLTRGRNNPAAISFLQFLKTEQAKNIISEFGYGIE